MTDTGAAKLPGLPVLKTSDVALSRWAQAVAEHLEVRNGARGNAAEKAVVQRDLTDLNATMAYLKEPKRTAEAGDTIIDLGGGMTASISTDKLVAALLANAKFKSALTSSATSAAPTTVSVPAGVDFETRGRVDEVSMSLAALKTLATDTAVSVKNLASSSGSSRGPVSLNGGWDRVRWPSFATVASWLVWVEFGGDIGRIDFADSSHLVIGDTVALQYSVSRSPTTANPSTESWVNTTRQWRGSARGWVAVTKMDAALANGTVMGDFGYTLFDLINYLFGRVGDGTVAATISSKTLIKDYDYTLKDLIEYIYWRVGDGTVAARLSSATTVVGYDGVSLKGFLDYTFNRIGYGSIPANLHPDTMINGYYTLKDLIEYIYWRIGQGSVAATLNWNTVINAGVGASPYTFADLGRDVGALRTDLSALALRVAALEARP